MLLKDYKFIVSRDLASGYKRIKMEQRNIVGRNTNVSKDTEVYGTHVITVGLV